MSQRLEKTKRTEAEKKAQKKYIQKCYQFYAAINRETYPEEAAYLESLPHKALWVRQKARLDLDEKK